MEYESMGKLIQSLRREKGLTQKQLAEMLNLTDKAISKWERDLACPDVATIPKLAKILGVSVEELLDAKADSTYDADQDLACENPIEETETDYEDQEYREYYYGELKRTLTAAAIAFLVFVSIFANLMGGDVGAVVVSALSGLVFSGIPCGWEITGKVFGRWYMTGVGGILVLFLRATLSGAIGVFALPIKLISFIKKCCGNTYDSRAVQKNKKQMTRKVVKALVLYVVALLAICIAAFIGVWLNE